MKTNALARINHIDPARLKRLKKKGITTVAQLLRMPVEELAAIESIGKHDAIRIKKAAAASCSEQTPPPVKTAPAKTADDSRIDRELNASLGKLAKRLNRANEKLKPLWKKKYLSLYIDFKKQSKKLSRHIKTIKKRDLSLSAKDKEAIIEEAGKLSQILAMGRKRPKKKVYKKITRKIKSFSGKLKAHTVQENEISTHPG